MSCVFFLRMFYYQVEFAPLETELDKTAWKHLPTLAMPDGAHNYDRDTVYFHLPSLESPNETVFGVACYQVFCEMRNIHTTTKTNHV